MTDELKQKIKNTFSSVEFEDQKKVVSVSIIYSNEISGAYKEGDRVE